jgi:hypothetical protein
MAIKLIHIDYYEGRKKNRTPEFLRGCFEK